MGLSRNALVLLASAAYAHAQGPPYGGGGYPNYPGSGNNNNNDNGSGDGLQAKSRSPKEHIVIAHAVLATVAFGFLFPVGGILIRLGSFKRLWLVHGLFQTLAYAFYIVAAALGIYIATNTEKIGATHAIIGLTLLGVLFLQPFLGLLHHSAFKQYNRRVVWSYIHIWIGRLAIPLGIINGGLGLELAQQMHSYAPSEGDIIGYSVAAGTIWLIYFVCSIYGEKRRSRAQKYRSVEKGESHETLEGNNNSPARYS